MNYPLIQFVLAGGSRNSEGWVNILIIVVFVVIWVIRNLFMAQKEQNQRQNKHLPRNQDQKTPINSQKAPANKDRVEQFLESILQPKKPSQERQSRPGVKTTLPLGVAARQKVTALKQAFKDEPVISTKARENTQAPVQPVSDLPLEPGIYELPKVDSHIQGLPDMLLTFSEIDELKKAILYKEILGKPISLRESSQNFY